MIKKFIPIALCALVAIGGFMFYGMVSSDTESDILEQQREISDLTNKIAMAEADFTSVELAASESVTGLSLARVAQDDEIAEALMEDVCTWYSWEEYMETRERIMRMYDLTEDDEFIKAFMPEVANMDADGKHYNDIDVFGYNMTFESLDSHVIGISADVYSYFSVVSVSARNDNGNEAMATCVVMYKVTNDGELSGLSAMPISA